MKATMGFLRKLFSGGSKPDRRTPLEKSVDNITLDFVMDQVKTLADDLKVPYAQAMSVMLFARVFTKGLREFFEELPEPFRANWPFPHDRMYMEVVAFYWFAILRNAKPKLSADDDEDEYDWDDSDEAADQPKQPVDPYSDGLNTSLQLCSSLVHSLMDKSIHEHYMINRAHSYMQRHRTKNEGPVETLAGHIMSIWNPSNDGRPVLDLSSPLGPITALIANMPVGDVIKSCRDLYANRKRIRQIALSPKSFPRR